MEQTKTKSILVTYLERNKVLKIPESNKAGDVEFLEKEFRKEFKFHSNVSLNVTFQRFDSDWGEYVDLDEDCTLVHKDKLKAVVSPLLTTPSTDSCELLTEDTGPGTSRATTPISRENLVKPRQLYCHSRCTDTDAETGNVDSPLPSSGSEDDYLLSGGSRKHVNVFPDSPDEHDNSTTNPESSSTSTSHTGTPIPNKKRKLVKTEDDAIPLPDPFPLPKHYRADVEVALKSGKMTKETTSAFLSAIAGAMFVYKRYPTRDDYICVARSVIQKYSFMASPAGTPHGAIVIALMNRFKEFRRTPVKRGNSSANPKKSPKKKSPGITQSPLQPWLASGEDSVSFERHNRVLLVEFNKTRRNQQVVADLMDRTFPFRRKAILEKVQDLDSLFKDFPFPQESDQLMEELERITEKKGLKESTRSTWKEIAPKIVSQARLESHCRGVDSALQVIKDCEDNVELAALIILPALLPDPRCKMDTSRIVYMAQGSTDVGAVVEHNRRLEPYVVIVGESSLQSYLIVDKHVIDEIDFVDIPFALMAAFFVYNICYPKGCTNFYTFLEIVVLKYSAEKAPPSVKFLLSKISAH